MRNCLWMACIWLWWGPCSTCLSPV